MWGVKLVEVYSDVSFVDYGVLPRDFSGIKGVFLSPFIHKDFKHLINNTFPIIVLGSLLCYFYKKNYRSIFPMLYIVSGILLWGDLSNHHIWFLLFIVTNFGLLGAYDDYKKIKFKNSSGISFS